MTEHTENLRDKDFRHWYRELSDIHWRVLNQLYRDRYTRFRNNLIYPSELSEDVGIDKTQARYRLEQLRKWGLLRRESKVRPVYYTPLSDAYLWSKVEVHYDMVYRLLVREIKIDDLPPMDEIEAMVNRLYERYNNEVR